MGLVEIIDIDAINYLSGLSDKSFETAMAMIERNRKEQEEKQISIYVKKFNNFCEELKANGLIFQLYDTCNKESYDINFEDIRIRRKK